MAERALALIRQNRLYLSFPLNIAYESDVVARGFGYLFIEFDEIDRFK